MSNWTPDQFRAYAQRRLKNEARARERMQNANNTVVKLPNPKREHDSRPALVKGTPRDDQGKTCVAIRVRIISCRARLLDLDNLVAGAKQLRDIIAESIGIDDGDARIEWEVEQVRTRGEQGTIITVENV